MNPKKKQNIFREKKLSNEKKIIIYNQIKKSICKIITKDYKIISGYFCIIKYPDIFNYLPVLIINNYEFGENDIIIDKRIEFILNSNEKSYILIDESRKLYMNKNYNIIIIEIKKNDKIDINQFLEIDDDIYKDNINNIYKNKEIYEIYYNKDGDIQYFFGKIKKVDDDYNIEYFNSYDSHNYINPIINLNNNKLIGINNNLNNGILIKVPINQFIKISRVNNINNIENRVVVCVGGPQH